MTRANYDYPKICVGINIILDGKKERVTQVKGTNVKIKGCRDLVTDSNFMEYLEEKVGDNGEKKTFSPR